MFTRTAFQDSGSTRREPNGSPASNETSCTDNVRVVLSNTIYRERYLYAITQGTQVGTHRHPDHAHGQAPAAASRGGVPQARQRVPAGAGRRRRGRHAGGSAPVPVGRSALAGFPGCTGPPGQRSPTPKTAAGGSGAP